MELFLSMIKTVGFSVTGKGILKAQFIRCFGGMKFSLRALQILISKHGTLKRAKVAPFVGKAIFTKTGKAALRSYYAHRFFLFSVFLCALTQERENRDARYKNREMSLLIFDAKEKPRRRSRCLLHGCSRPAARTRRSVPPAG